MPHRERKKKYLLFFFALTHTNYLSQRQKFFFSILQYVAPFSFLLLTMWHPISFSFSLCGTLIPNKPYLYIYLAATPSLQHTNSYSNTNWIIRSPISNRILSLHGFLATKPGWTHNNLPLQPTNGRRSSFHLFNSILCQSSQHKA